MLTKVDAAGRPPPASEVFSPSSVNCFSECEAKWFYRKVLQIPETRGAALGLGTAVHEAPGENFRQKIHTLEDLPYEGVRTVFRDSMAKQFDEIVLAPETTRTICGFAAKRWSACGSGASVADDNRLRAVRERLV